MPNSKFFGLMGTSDAQTILIACAVQSGSALKYLLWIDVQSSYCKHKDNFDHSAASVVIWILYCTRELGIIVFSLLSLKALIITAADDFLKYSRTLLSRTRLF